jgi:peptidyl-prolyl cis-trans isomerase C
MRDTRAWSRLAAVGLAILVGGGLAHGQAAPGDVAVVVNGEPISMAEVQAVVKAQTPQSMQLTAAQQRQQESEAVEQLIDDLLTRQFMRQSAPPVSERDIDEQLAKFKASFKAGHTTYEEQLKNSGMTEAKVRASITFLMQREAYLRAHVTEAAMRRCFDENRDYFNRVSVKASHIMIRVAPNAPDAERQAAREKLLALRQQIVAGQLDFAEAAKKYSQSPSALDGGDIGYFSRKWMLEENFARAAFALKVGDVSDVVQTETGMHLIKVTDRKQDGPNADYEKSKELVRETAAEELLEALLPQLRKAARIEYKQVQGLGTQAR